MSQTTLRPLSKLESQVLSQVRQSPGKTFEDYMNLAAWDEQRVHALAYLIANFYVLRDDITNALTAAEWSMSHK